MLSWKGIGDSLDIKRKRDGKENFGRWNGRESSKRGWRNCIDSKQLCDIATARNHGERAHPYDSSKAVDAKALEEEEFATYLT